jgi:enoyl-CoA hydratase/carnithine racemase
VEYTDIRYEVRGDAAWITLNRPEVMNALRLRSLEELEHAAGRAAVESGIAAVVVTGAGDRAFCAGGDVGEMRDLDKTTGRRFLERFVAAAMALRHLPVPVVARIRGFCLAGGNELNLACDLAIADEDAWFGHAGPQVGSVPVILGTQLMPRLCGERFAKEVIFLCKRYPAREALAHGWVNAVVPRERLDEEVEATVQRLASMSPTALRLAKASINTESELVLGPSLRAGVEMLSAVYGSDELREGMTAFLEKRKPDFRRFRG